MLRQKFKTLVQNTGFDPGLLKKKQICVGVSGGSDSLCLAVLLSEYSQQFSIELTALIVDHGLRPESPLEAIQTQKTLRELDINAEILSLKGSAYSLDNQSKKDIQNRARLSRYQIIQDWCLNHNCTALFLAHHKGDQLETQIMRLRQGSGLMGVCGMQPKTRFQTLDIYRPFLNESKSDLQDFLTNQSISWIEDPSNQNDHFERVFWRDALSQSNLTDPILRSSYAHDLKAWAVRFLQKHGSVSHLGYISLKLESLLKLPTWFQKELLRHCIHHLGTSPYPPSLDKIPDISDKKDSRFTFSPFTLNGLRISKRENDLIMAREYKRCDRILIHPKASMPSSRVWDQRFLVQYPTTLESTFTIQNLNEQEWKILLQKVPQLKTLSVPRYALWSLPILNTESETFYPDLLVKTFENQLESQSDQIRSLNTFSCVFLGKTLHQHFSIPK